MGMRLIKSWKSVCLLAFFTNLATLFYMLTRLDPKCHCYESEGAVIKALAVQNNQATSKEQPASAKLAFQEAGVAPHVPEGVILDASRVKEIEDSITVVMREFEYFENDVVKTVASVLNVFPKISIVIISDQVVYPPLKLQILSNIKDINLKLINIEPQPQHSVNESRPLHHIATKYVLILPDSVRMGHSSIEDIYSMMTKLNVKPKVIAATKLKRDHIVCLGLRVDLRKWTLTYNKLKDRDRTDNSFVCDALEGNHLLLLRKEILSNLSHPWSRPFPSTIYVQTALRNTKVHVLKNIAFDGGEVLFKGEHNRMKHTAYSGSRKAEFFQSFGIKKVVNQKGEALSYGCSKSTPRCFGTVLDDMPDYLFRHRWTPPCCLENLRETARHVFQILEKCGVRYWLEGGSLLGAVRYEDVIPWDYDVDVGIYREDIAKCEWLKNAQKQLIVDMQGFAWEKAQEGDFLRVQFSQTNHMHVDIFPFYVKDGTMTKDHWFPSHRQDVAFPERYLKPLLKIKFIGMYVSAPNNIREFLEMKFGKGVIENPQYPNPELLHFPKNSESSNKAHIS